MPNGSKKLVAYRHQVSLAANELDAFLRMDKLSFRTIGNFTKLQSFIHNNVEKEFSPQATHTGQFGDPTILLWVDASIARGTYEQDINFALRLFHSLPKRMKENRLPSLILSHPIFEFIKSFRFSPNADERAGFEFLMGLIGEMALDEIEPLWAILKKAKKPRGPKSGLLEVDDNKETMAMIPYVISKKLSVKAAAINVLTENQRLNDDYNESDVRRLEKRWAQRLKNRLRP